MGPWSNPSSAKTQTSTARGLAEWALIIGLAALVILGAVAVWCSRYEIGVAAGVPARLDRFTGQVIGCVPGQGCLELIPAGEPQLRSAVVHHIPGVAATPAPAGNSTAPLAAPPASAPSKPAAAAQDKPHR